jgi:7-keto-8-aminopelargonate synthetase-like enzyme
MAALDVLMQEPEIIERLWDNTRFFKEGLQRLGFDTGLSESPITPVIAGEGAKAMLLSGQAVRARRVRAGDRVSDGGARQGARADDRDRDAHA